jgi:hypothetical protein
MNYPSLYFIKEFNSMDYKQESIKDYKDALLHHEYNRFCIIISLVFILTSKTHAYLSCDINKQQISYLWFVIILLINKQYK